jgi:hypothetical protein
MFTLFLRYLWYTLLRSIKIKVAKKARNNYLSERKIYIILNLQFDNIPLFESPLQNCLSPDPLNYKAFYNGYLYCPIKPSVLG